MSSGVDSDLLDQAQKAGNADSAMEAYINSALKNLHTSLPGIIASVDLTTQTASVQPCIQRIFTENGAVNLPVCLDVPLYYPSGGGFVLTFPVAVGDECLLCFSERCIDYWFANGGVQLPAEYRLHDLSDAFAFVGFRSQPNKLANVQADGMEMRTVDRSTYIKLTAGTIYMKGNLVHEGNVSQTGNLTRTGTTTLTGNASVTGTMQNNGTNIGSTHRHQENDVHGLTGTPQ